MLSIVDPLKANDMLQLATIYRDCEMNVIYVCYHCGCSFTNNLDILTHVDIHFDLKVDVKINSDDENLAFGDTRGEIRLESVRDDKSEINKLLTENNVNRAMLSDDCDPGCIKIERQIVKEEFAFPEYDEDATKFPLTQCKLCDVNFLSPSLLIIHLYNDHANTTTMYCPECSENWTDETKFVCHLQRYIDDNVTTFDALIDKVMSRCIPTLTVDTIKRPFTKYQMHFLKTCDICSATFSSVAKIKSHMRIEHLKKDLFDCDKCNRKVVGIFTLYAHKYAHLTDDNQVNVLDDETLRQNLRKLLDDNIYCDETTSNKTYKCKLCDQVSLTRRKGAVRHILQKHIYYRKAKPPKGNHTCEYCGMKFGKSCDLSRHKLKHTATEKPFKCLQCKKSFSQSRYLRRHEQIHLEINPHQCSECGMTFKIKNGLNKHIRRVHSSIITKCTICGKEVRDHRLKQHMKDVHESEHRPYQCTVCTQTFKTAKTLKTHSYRHSGEKRFECRFHCKKQFSSSSARRAHERSRHEPR